jgi:hypothetical protein
MDKQVATAQIEGRTMIVGPRKSMPVNYFYALKLILMTFGFEIRETYRLAILEFNTRWVRKPYFHMVCVSHVIALHQMSMRFVSIGE